jgi:hypothetical protein
MLLMKYASRQSEVQYPNRKRIKVKLISSLAGDGILVDKLA